MASPQEIATFLESVERKAFKQAVYAVREDEAALDIVQDSMLKLAERYADRPASELAPLFQRILQNTILDHFRRQKVRNTWVTLLSSLRPASEPDDPSEHDMLETMGHPDDGTGDARSAAAIAEGDQILRLIESEIARLPNRQREAFIMRYWQDMDVAETAAAMGCSEGSVKTHCSRATHTLAAALRAKGITL